jgi:pimeloyl-ACP methyl ester carboxylesterase
MNGWGPWNCDINDPNLRPTYVRYACDGEFFVAIFSAVVGSECVVVHSKLGELWRGKSIRNESLSISDRSGCLMWVGHPRGVSRCNSTHPRIFVFSQAGIRTVSPDGQLVISSGFLYSSDEAWFTIQAGVADLRTFFFDPETGSIRDSTKAPITGKSASAAVYKTESLTEYPSIVYLGDHESVYPLPRNAAAEKLTCSKWHHSQRPSLQGIWYSCKSGIAHDERPVLIHLHGGPAMALSPFRRTLIESSDWLLPLVEKAHFDILSLAYSGSLGFGDQFAQSVIGHQGMEEIDDIIDAVSELRSSGRFVAGIFGGSYGGYLSLHAYCSTNTELKSVPRFVALYPYISSRGCAAETGDFAWEAEYTGVNSENIWPIPSECVQPDVLPHLYEADVTRPLMLFHGDSDNVCPLSQSKQTFNILRQRGAKDNISLTVYKGEGHGFRDPEIRSHCIERIISFFKGEEC